MKLLTSDLRKFGAASSSIKKNNLMPILNYLKFDNGYITKNNLESFIIMKADFTGSALIDENILMSFVNFTNEKEITVTVKDKHLVISDGKSKVTSPTEDLSHFPVNVETDGDSVQFTSDVLYNLRSALGFTMDDKTMPFKEHVFIGNGLLSASTGFICFTQAVDKAIPETILSRDASAALIKFEEVTFSQNDTYQFFQKDDFKYGFIKTDLKFLNMKLFSLLPEGDHIPVNKSELVKFCEICINNTPSRIVSASSEGEKLVMVDKDYGVTIETPVSFNIGEFTFNPSIMLKMLKSVPDEQLKFVRAPSKYFVTGESGFVGLIMEIVKQ